MKSIRFFRLFSGGLAAALCIVSSAAGAGAQTPPPLITEAFADAENATLTFNGAGFREGFPVVFLGNQELPVRWATEATAAVWLPDLRPGTYRLIARWPDGSQADFYLTLGAAGPAGSEGSRGPEGPRGLPGPGVAAHFGDPPAATAEGTAADTAPANPFGTTRYGNGALGRLTTGMRNTAFGLGALSGVTIGGSNTAVGYLAMGGQYSFSGSISNTAVGSTALQNGTGSGNIAVGRAALRYSRGSRNVAIGGAAGFSNPAGNDNIYIKNLGVAGESGIIRIGTAGASGTPGAHTETHLTGAVYLPQAVFVGTPPTSLEGLLAGIRRDVVDLEGRVGSLENLPAPRTPAAP